MGHHNGYYGSDQHRLVLRNGEVLAIPPGYRLDPVRYPCEHHSAVTAHVRGTKDSGQKEQVMRRKKDGTLGFITNRRLNNEQSWLETRIERLKNHKGFWIQEKPPSNTQAKIEQIRKTYHDIPKAIETANAGRRRVNEKALWRLDGQCGNALKRRGVDGPIGAEYICVDFSVLPDKSKWLYTIEPVYAWYAPQWFTDYANRIRDRRQMYRRFDKLKDAGQDAIDSEIGLLILEAT